MTGGKAQEHMDLRRTIAEISGGLRTALTMALPWTLRGLCVAALIAGATWSGPLVFVAFGGDLLALLPAAAVVLLPAAAAQMAGLGWGGLLFAGIVTLCLGALIDALPQYGRALVIVGALAAVSLYFAQSQSPAERTNVDEQIER
jgi:hypothetical protein